MTKNRSGFASDAADAIWNSHIGQNAYVRHRDQCASCLAAYKARGSITKAPDGSYSAPLLAGCNEGERIFGEMLDEVLAAIDEAQSGN